MMMNINVWLARRREEKDGEDYIQGDQKLGKNLEKNSHAKELRNNWFAPVCKQIFSLPSFLFTLYIPTEMIYISNRLWKRLAVFTVCILCIYISTILQFGGEAENYQCLILRVTLLLYTFYHSHSNPSSSLIIVSKWRNEFQDIRLTLFH